MDERTYYTVLIYIQDGKQSLFRAYEEQAMPLMRRHGGRVEFMMTSESASGAYDLPDEIHVLSFASPEGFSHYRQDPDVVALAPLREESVQRAVFIPGKRLKMPVGK